MTSSVSEAWQAGKWLNEVDLNDLSLMWADWSGSPYRHFYIKEIAQLNNGSFVIPLRFMKCDGKEVCEAYEVTQEVDVSQVLISGPTENDSSPLQQTFTVHSSNVKQIMMTSFYHNVLDISEVIGEIVFNGKLLQLSCSNNLF